MDYEFAYEWKDLSLTVQVVELRGSLDRGIDCENDASVKSLQDEIRLRSQSKVIVLDLNALDAWDTEGIRAIVGQVVEPLVRKKARIAFAGPKYFLVDGAQKLSQLYDDAKIKFGLIDTGELPWEETVELALTKLGVLAS